MIFSRIKRNMSSGGPYILLMSRLGRGDASPFDIGQIVTDPLNPENTVLSRISETDLSERYPPIARTTRTAYTKKIHRSESQVDALSVSRDEVHSPTGPARHARQNQYRWGPDNGNNGRGGLPGRRPESSLWSNGYDEHMARQQQQQQQRRSASPWMTGGGFGGVTRRSPGVMRPDDYWGFNAHDIFPSATEHCESNYPHPFGGDTTCTATTFLEPRNGKDIEFRAARVDAHCLREFPSKDEIKTRLADPDLQQKYARAQSWLACLSSTKTFYMVVGVQRASDTSYKVTEYAARRASETSADQPGPVTIAYNLIRIDMDHAGEVSLSNYSPSRFSEAVHF
ncbi:uncharacterized protein BO97DRAFT_239719 [Aspergillus homomorphus CBS 101889]|uniref:Uncharacterized protein n=1 Tax=Aspergillus homomorphus (strain CBS 101889) TaxID=1450537 RepID=A0A395I754_ASPHC|nr:hypothetical protein BO97DRAFT_239719 [Aspergillus homomorphus CBS 101889]RAL15123.1 hypothetical protein BO97DRAFT_239719 [Aspergillus homomorphus CBS 101889]